MRIQKIIRHGNAVAVVIPAQFCKEMGWKRGDRVFINIAVTDAKDVNKRAFVFQAWKPKKAPKDAD